MVQGPVRDPKRVLFHSNHAKQLDVVEMLCNQFGKFAVVGFCVALIGTLDTDQLNVYGVFARSSTHSPSPLPQWARLPSHSTI